MTHRWLLWSLLGPSQVLLILIIAGAALLAIGWLRSGRLLVLVGGAGLFAFGLLPTAIYIANPLETRFPQPNLPAKVHGIILLTGAERPAASEAYGEPQLNAHGDRFITTLRLVERFPGARIVVSGGPRTVPGKGSLETQAAVAAEILGTVGLDPARVSLEDTSRDTCSSAANMYVFVKPLPGESWVVVTSAMHMPRTVAVFPRGRLAPDHFSASGLPDSPGGLEPWLDPDSRQSGPARYGSARVAGAVPPPV